MGRILVGLIVGMVLGVACAMVYWLGLHGLALAVWAGVIGVRVL